MIDRLYGGETFFGGSKVAQRYCQYMEALAEQLVELYWNEIEHVAHALLERGKLNGEEFQACLLAGMISDSDPETAKHIKLAAEALAGLTRFTRHG